MQHPVKVGYIANTTDGEQITGEVYTINTEQMRDALEQILNKLAQEELLDLCLQTQAI